MSASVRYALLAGSAFVSLVAFIPASLAASSTANMSGSAATNTGDPGTAPVTDTPGGDGGPSIVFGSPTITLTNPSGSVQTGGTGGTGGPDTDSSGGNAGGTGGAGIQFNGQNGSSANAGDFPSLVNGGAIVGGTGGTGGAGNNSAGGAGGMGNNGVGDDASFSSITSSGTISGGAGGTGGTGVGTDQSGGNGGLGGGGIAVTGANVTVSVTGAVTGGAGGMGGDATGAGTNGSGGNGNAGIAFGSASSSLTIGAGGTVTGGDGGAAGTGGTGGTAGIGGVGIGVTAAASVTNHGTIVAGGTGEGAAALAIFGSVTTLTNDGTIGASDAAGPALLTQNAGTTIGTFDNTGGTLLSAAAGGLGTVIFGDDVGNLTLTGGNIVNDDAADNTGAALLIASDQTGTITNVSTLTANGTGTGLGFGVLFAGNATFVNAASGTINGALATLADQNVTLTNAGTINGAVTLGGNGDHTLTSAGGTINGAVTLAGTGANSLVLAGGQIRGATTLDTATVTVSGDYQTAGTITATTAAATTVDAGVTFTAANAIDLGSGAFTDNGATQVTDGGLTTTGAATVAAGGALFVGADSAVGALSNDGTVGIATGHILTATSAVGSGSYVFDVAAASDPASPTSASSGYGRLVVTGAPVTLSAANISAAVAGHGYMTTGDQLQIAHGNGAASITGGKIADNSFIYDFTLAPGGGANAGTADDAVLIVSRLSPSAFATSAENLQIANALDAIGNGDGDSGLTAVQASLGAAPTQAQANADLDSLKPQVNGGTVQAAVSSTTDTFNIAGQQMAMLRDGDSGASGMAAGNEANGLRGWAEGFGGHAHEDDRSGVAGYSANTGGGTVGVDSQDILDDTILGASFSYGHTHVDSADDADADVDGYQATLYGSRYLTEIDRDLFIDGMLAAAYQRNDETRNDIGGVTDLDAKGNYNSWEGAGRAELGRDIAVPALGGVTVTPSLMTDYTYYRSESYSESGAGGAGLDVDAASENIWNVGAGLQATWIFADADGSYLKPDVRAQYKYDLLNDDKLDVTSNFQAGGPAFSTNGLNPSNQTLNAGADLRFYTTSNWEFVGSYDFTWKPDYIDNSGLIRVAYRF